MRRATALLAIAIVGASLVLASVAGAVPAKSAHVLRYTTGGTLKGSYGGSGSGKAGFNWPHHVATNKDGSRVFISDNGNQRVQVLTSSGKYVRQWKVTYPEGIAVNRYGEVFVADNWYKVIRVYSSAGKPLRQFGSPGSGDGQLDLLGGLAATPSGGVLVCDWGNNRIQEFDRQGAFVRKWGSYGSDPGMLYNACGLAVASDGSVYVADVGNGRVQHFSSTGGYLGSYGKNGATSEFTRLWGVTVDKNGHVYATDFAKGVVVFDDNGTVLKRWKLPKGLRAIMGIHYDPAKKAVWAITSP
jgi:DNA-binding beta-propeller fold protein YncE